MVQSTKKCKSGMGQKWAHGPRNTILLKILGCSQSPSTPKKKLNNVHQLNLNWFPVPNFQRIPNMTHTAHRTLPIAACAAACLAAAEAAFAAATAFRPIAPGRWLLSERGTGTAAKARWQRCLQPSHFLEYVWCPILCIGCKSLIVLATFPHLLIVDRYPIGGEFI